MAAASINAKGQVVVAQGVLNLDDLTLEADGFTEPVELKAILEKFNMNGKFVKIQVTEADTPLVETDL